MWFSWVSPSDGDVIIAVRDTGMASRREREKVFEPYFGAQHDEVRATARPTNRARYFAWPSQIPSVNDTGRNYRLYPSALPPE